MKRICYLLIVISLANFFSISAQTFNMESLDDPRTNCETWKYQQVDYYTWGFRQEGGKWDYGVDDGYNNPLGEYGVKNSYATRHTIIREDKADEKVPQLRTLPPGETTCVRLGKPFAFGNINTSPRFGPRAEHIDFEYKVTKDNAIVLFKYAVVMHAPQNHNTSLSDNQVPQIYVEIYNSNGNKINDKLHGFYMLGKPSLETSRHFTPCTIDGERGYWHDWQLYGFDCSAYIGQTLYFFIENDECAILTAPVYGVQDLCGKHYSYIYFHLSTQVGEIRQECTPQGLVLTAPDGFNYQWYNTSNGQMLGEEQTLTLAETDGKTTYECRLFFKGQITSNYSKLTITPESCDKSKEVTDYIDTCSAALPFTWRPWSNGGKGYEITSAEQAKTIKDEVKRNGTTILEDSIVTLNLTLHEAQKVPVEVKDTFWQCDYDLGEDNWINLVVDDYELGEIELDIPNAIGTTYKTLDQDIYGCDSITIHEVIIIPEKVQRLFEFCQSDLSLGDNNYINIEIEPRLILEGTFWGNFSGDSIIRDTTQSVYCFGFDSITIDTIRIYPAYRETWSPGLCADEMKDALADGIPFYDLGPVTDLSQNGLEYYTEGSIHGCDSIIVLDLTPIPNDTIDEHVQIPAFPYTFRGVTFNSIEDTLFIKTPQEPCNMYTKLIPDYIDTLKTEIIELACMEFTWDENGKTYTDSGTDTVFLRSFDDKLDSIVVLHLTIAQPPTQVEDTIAEACLSFEWYGKTYTQSGDYPETLHTKAGCDSTVTLHLTIYEPTIVKEENITACETFEWYGQTYTQSGTYEHELPENEHGCIDKEILHLTIGTTPAPVDLGEQIIGIGNVFTVFEGTPYQQSFDTDGKHTATGRTVLGCDSVVELTLVVLTTLEEDVYDTICQGEKYEWNSIEYTESGDYDYETVSVIGIDSIAHLHLTVNLPSSSETTAASCAPYTWFGQNYYESGDQEYHLTNAAGCDSTITLHLTIYPDYKNVQDGVTICPEQLPYTVNGVTFTQADAYTTVSNHYKQATKTMNLTTVNGCDSIVHFTLTVQTPTDEQQTETACDNQLPYRWNPTEGYTQDLSEGGTYNYTLKSSLGCDSIHYSLNLTIDRDYLQAVPALTFETCANDEALQIALNHTVGTPAAYDITFDDKATAQGLQNISHEDMPNDYIIAVPLPRNEDSTRYVRPDDYSLTLTVYDQCDRQTDYPLGFRILYPSWLIQQRWRDVLALYNDKYNGGYNFASIRWYKNGVEIQGRGAHNSYVQMSPVLEMATYYALLTRADDGKALRTCDFVPNLASPYYAPDVEKIRLMQQSDARHITVQTELSGEYIVYDVTGKQIMTGHFGQAYGNPAIVFSPALADGAYIIHFHANDGTEDTKKWLIH